MEEHRKLEFRPDAAKNFNEKAQGLLAEVAPGTVQAPAELPTHILRPDAPVAHEFSEKDLIEFKITGQSDQLGRTTARYFEHEGGSSGLRTRNTKNWPVSRRAYRRPERCAMLSALSGSRT